MMAVAECGVAIHDQLDLAVDAADGPQQDVLSLVVRGRTPVPVGSLVLVVPRADQQGIPDDDPAALRRPTRLQDHRPGQIAARSRHSRIRGPEAEAAGVAVEHRPEHAGRVDTGEAQPLHVAARCDQRRGVAVREEGVVRDRGKRAETGRHLVPYERVDAPAEGLCSGVPKLCAHWWANYARPGKLESGDSLVRYRVRGTPSPGAESYDHHDAHRARSREASAR